MEDKLLVMFFETRRWEDALNKGSVKGIDKPVLRELMSPAGRKELMAMIMMDEYHIERPHTAKIPKDTPGEFRTVFVNNDRDRIFLSLLNDLLFDIAGDMIHSQCTSYQKGIGCNKVVSDASKLIEKLSDGTQEYVGWKSDLSKYFDSVPIEFIDEAFDKVESRFGKSKIIDVVREYYHNDKYYDSELKMECEKFQSLKQGCAVASWLADMMLYHIDEKLSGLSGYYVRYSDDTLYIGKDFQMAMDIMVKELGKMGMSLNPKKVEYLNKNKWFKFLGYSIRGKDISLSGNRIKSFVKEVTDRTTKQIRNGVKYDQALHKTMSWLYYGNGEHAWATQVLKTINVQSDINKLNGFVMDCLRAVCVGKSVGMNDIGGLGWVRNGKSGCIDRGKGRKVRTLRGTGTLKGYYSLGCMRKNLMFSRDLYDSIVRDL